MNSMFRAFSYGLLMFARTGMGTMTTKITITKVTVTNTDMLIPNRLRRYWRKSRSLARRSKLLSPLMI